MNMPELTKLQRELFDFAHRADHLNSELRELKESEDYIEVNNLRDYLNVIARKAEYVSSVVK